MKLRILLVCCLLLSVLAGVSFVGAQDAATCEVASLFDAYAYASPDGSPNGAVFGKLVNLSAEADTLVSVSSAVAEAVELHETIMGDGDVMQMRPIEGGIPVEPQNFVSLQPGGIHIMLINLTQPLVAGEMFELVLNFERLGEVTITVPVKDREAEMGAMDGGMMMPEMTSEAMMMPTEPVEWPEGCAKVHVVGAWARPAVPGAPNSAAYALLVNLTAAEDTLISASTTISAMTELHEMTMGAGDVMQMRPIEGGIVIPPGGVAVLEPGGKHVMLMGLTQELPAGTTIELTLTFAESGEVVLTIPVREPMEPGMPMSGM